ncbi:MAG: hypothetical protein IPK87_15425 [Planctomycetes bacterium]|nr:hypothetical protein [Planctomycetota bacterium]
MEASEYQPYPPEIHDFVDGRMDADAERAFRRRMETNAALAEQVEQLRHAIKLLHEIPAKQPPAGFDERLIGRIREEELADRARTRILPAPRPLWQHVVQVGIGAVAAALVLAVIGVPGMWDTNDPEIEGTGGLVSDAVAPTEEDLLPSLGDHYERFDSLRRNVSAMRVIDIDQQRQVLRIEMDSSDLVRRNLWLAGEVSRLPANRRVEYVTFLSQLDSALSAVDTEISASSRDLRAVDLARLEAALAGVKAPGTLQEGYLLATRRSVPDPRGMVAEGEQPLELQLYASIRRADYRHDPQGVIDAADELLRRRGRSEFKDYAHAAKVEALIRLNRDAEAAKYFNDSFSAFDSDLSEQQQAMLRAFFKDGDKLRLQAAREALK